MSKDLRLQPRAIKSILSRFRGKRILVIGDVGVDRYTMGIVERISPEAPVPIVAVQEEQLKLGLASNVADNLAALGGKPALIGIVGKDRTGEDFRKLLKRSSISTSGLITVPGRRTSLKERIVSERQQLLRVDHESTEPLSAKNEEEVFRKFARLLPRCHAVIVEDYSKGLLSERLSTRVYAEAKRRKIPVLADPNVRTPIHLYKGATVLTPNTREASALSGIRITDLSTLSRAGKKILEQTGAHSVVITRGKDGMALFEQGKKEYRVVPTYAREVYDVSGAGDTVIASLALALVSGAKLEEAVVIGNIAAGIVVGKRGTATVSREEILESLRSL